VAPSSPEYIANYDISNTQQYEEYTGFAGYEVEENRHGAGHSPVIAPEYESG
jgi:hypothetical protein